MSEKSRKKLLKDNNDLRDRFKLLSEKCEHLLYQREILLDMLRNARFHNSKLINWLRDSIKESKKLRADRLN